MVEGSCEQRGSLRAERLWTLPFMLLLPAALLGYANIYLLVPTIPRYFEHLGGSDADLGAAMAAFSGAALLTRPLAGWSIDRLGSRLVVMLGIGTMSAGAGAYLLANTIPAAMAARMLHGVGWGFFSVAGAAMASALAPPGRQGAFLGVYGMSGGIALAIAPVLGDTLGSGYETFVLAAVGGSLGLALAAGLPRADRANVLSAPRRPMLISREAFLPAGMTLIFMACYGAVFSFVPVLTEQRHIGGPGWFFTPYAGAMVLSRIVTGGLSDRHGRVGVIAPGMVLTSGALMLLALSADAVTLAGAALLFGMGMAAIYPVSLAWAADRSGPAKRGAAMATVTAAQDIGISSGAFVAGQIAGIAGLGGVYTAFAALAFAGFGLAAWRLLVE